MDETFRPERPSLNPRLQSVAIDGVRFLMFRALVCPEADPFEPPPQRYAPWQVLRDRNSERKARTSPSRILQITPGKQEGSMPAPVQIHTRGRLGGK